MAGFTFTLTQFYIMSGLQRVALTLTLSHTSSLSHNLKSCQDCSESLEKNSGSSSGYPSSPHSSGTAASRIRRQRWNFFRNLCNLDKYICKKICKFRQIHFAIWTPIFCNLNKTNICPFEQKHFSIWKHTFCKLDKYNLQIGQIHFVWTNMYFGEY